MGVYIFQLIFLLGSSAVVNNCSGLDKAKKHKMILAINIFLMWILCVLKKYTVGIDVAGYKRVYEASASWPWFAFSNVYYEYGYTALMQLFSKNGADFQIFNLFVYTIIYVPIFVFLTDTPNSRQCHFWYLYAISFGSLICLDYGREWQCRFACLHIYFLKKNRGCVLRDLLLRFCSLL